MPVYSETVTASKAAEAIQNRLAGPRGRIIPRKLAYQDEMKKKKIHVFNVGPWAQTVNTGSTGSFTIPACLDKDGEYNPERVPYVEMLVEDGQGNLVPPISLIMDELVIKSEAEYSRLEDDGMQFAQELLGEGRGQHPMNALRHIGMFASENEVPTKAELSAARELLRVKCLKYCKEAGDLHRTDAKLASRVIQPKVHFLAAKVVGRDNPTDSPWMLSTAPEGRTKCRMCGRVVDPDVAMCEGGHIVNQEIYLAAMAEQEAIQDAVAPKRGPGRPRKDAE